MSAVGKSSVVEELARRGHTAVDLDDPEWSEYGFAEPGSGDPDLVRDWLWKEDRVEDLLLSHDTGPLFVAGCAANQGRFSGMFDHIVLLTAPESVTRHRLATRTTNDFGKTPEELAKVLSDTTTFENRLRAAADVVIDTDAPLESVVERIIALGGDGRPG